MRTSILVVALALGAAGCKKAPTSSQVSDFDDGSDQLDQANQILQDLQDFVASAGPGDAGVTPDTGDTGLSLDDGDVQVSVDADLQEAASLDQQAQQAVDEAAANDPLSDTPSDVLSLTQSYPDVIQCKDGKALPGPWAQQFGYLCKKAGAKPVAKPSQPVPTVQQLQAEIAKLQAVVAKLQAQVASLSTPKVPATSKPTTPSTPSTPSTPPAKVTSNASNCVYVSVTQDKPVAKFYIQGCWPKGSGAPEQCATGLTPPYSVGEYDYIDTAKDCSQVKQGVEMDLNQLQQQLQR